MAGTTQYVCRATEPFGPDTLRHAAVMVKAAFEWDADLRRARYTPDVLEVVGRGLDPTPDQLHKLAEFLSAHEGFLVTVAASVEELVDVPRIFETRVALIAISMLWHDGWSRSFGMWLADFWCGFAYYRHGLPVPVVDPLELRRCRSADAAAALLM
jgi:hypothetical protein